MVFFLHGFFVVVVVVLCHPPFFQWHSEKADANFAEFDEAR